MCFFVTTSKSGTIYAERERERERERTSLVKNGFYSEEELHNFGFASLGENVKISRLARITDAHTMHIGSFVRIDNYCSLSGVLTLGDFVYIASSVVMRGGNRGIILKSFCSVDSKSTLYAGEEEESPPIIPETKALGRTARLWRLYSRRDEARAQPPLILEKHVSIGPECTVLPGVLIGEGAAVGGFSVVKKNLAPWGIYAGNPARKVKEREKATLLEQEKIFLEKLSQKS